MGKDMSEEKETPEHSSLQDNLVMYERSAACERRDRDRMIAGWRDNLHAALESTPTDYKLIHAVMDTMDDMLNRAGGRRK
jgi:hypothetical protein